MNTSDKLEQMVNSVIDRFNKAIDKASDNRIVLLSGSMFQHTITAHASIKALNTTPQITLMMDRPEDELINSIQKLIDNHVNHKIEAFELALNEHIAMSHN